MGKKMTGTMEANERLARVESGQEATQRDVGDIKKDLREMKEAIRHDLENVRASIERLADRPVCPQPGLCLEQKREMEAHRGEIADLKGRVRSIEDDANRAKGGGAALRWAGGALWAAAGVAVTAVIAWLSR